MNKLLQSIWDNPLVLVLLKILSFFIIPSSLTATQDSLTNQNKYLKTTTIGKNLKINGKNNKHDKDDIELIELLPSSPLDNVRLFPEIEKSILESKNSSAKPCSTNSSTKFLPIKNEFGEIEWTFADDGFDSTSINSNDFYPVQYQQQNQHHGQQQHGQQHYQTDIQANHQMLNMMNMQMMDPPQHLNHNVTNVGGIENMDKISPITSNSSSNSFDDKTTPKSLTPSESNDEKNHQCPHCEATFKLRGYLTRHIKKHSIKKAYSCPFHKFLTYIDDNNVTHKCHPTGGFSRRDTYKTHLKSRHFKYPKGTATKERSKSSGNCSMCGEFFPNSEIWCEIHIEGGECKFLPIGFKGKSRIKNKLRKELKKKGMNEDEFFNNLNNLSPQSQTSELNDFQQLAQHRQRYQSPDNIKKELITQSTQVVSQQPIKPITAQSTPQQQYQQPNPSQQQPPQQYQQYYQQQTPQDSTPQSQPSSTIEKIKIEPVQPIPVSMPNEQHNSLHQNSITNSLPNSTFSNIESSPYYSSTQSTPVNQIKPQLPINELDPFLNWAADYDDEFCLDLDQRPTSQPTFDSSNQQQQQPVQQPIPAPQQFQQQFKNSNHIQENMMQQFQMIQNQNQNQNQNLNHLQLNQYQMNLMNNQIPLNMNNSQNQIHHHQNHQNQIPNQNQIHHQQQQQHSNFNFFDDEDPFFVQMVHN